MVENNKSYRVRTKIGTGINSPQVDRYLTVKLDNTIDTIEMMSLKISKTNFYRLSSAKYGVVVGRAIANGGFGVPNVRVSIFIPANEETLNDPVLKEIYPYSDINVKDSNKVRYNLLDDVTDDDCHRDVGTFPTKRMVLDDDNYLEIFDKYYKFTTRTNASGDYMIFGVPVGSWQLHVDMDLSDIGVLSQKPRDMIYKGYHISQFDSPNQFKESNNLDSLPQIISQDTAVYIYPFWGDAGENIIGITRHDIDIDYKFEPTCVFMGSIISDTNTNRISKKCIPSDSMGSMEDLVTGPGTIEMIRKTITGTVEEYSIQGNQLIDDHGVWCYQIPMNLDYMMTDEYGNLVPSDNPEKGIATRASVRFRVSMNDLSDDNVNTYRCKVLIPNNPKITKENPTANPDYVFGTLTDESSYRDLFWNNIYTVKSFIPRFQRGNGNRNRRFSGIKMCNYYGSNNPMPYNNMRVRLSFKFRISCLLVKLLIALIGVYNRILSFFVPFFVSFTESSVLKTLSALSFAGKDASVLEFLGKLLAAGLTLGFTHYVGLMAYLLIRLGEKAKSFSCLYIDGSLCSSLEDEWYFAPGCTNKDVYNHKPLWVNMMNKIEGKNEGEPAAVPYNNDKKDGLDDKVSIDYTNKKESDEIEKVEVEGKSYSYVISRGVEYFKQCIEISLAEEYRAIQFDFYNDWINGTVYIPRWERHIKRKRRFWLFGKVRTVIRACNETFSSKKIKFTEQCALSVKLNNGAVVNKVGCKSNSKRRYICHKRAGRQQVSIFNTAGVVHQELTSSELYAYYFKPCEVFKLKEENITKKVNLFATDIALLGSFNDYSFSETPRFIDNLQTTTYQLPTPLALTNAEEEGFSYTLSEEGKENGNFLSDYEGGHEGLYVITDGALTTMSVAGFTEMSGVDWGFTGPGQGTPNERKNYTPGGHFLGISCMNSAVTTKSCVNLRRICEIGVWPSSDYRYTNGYLDRSAPRDVEVIPNGLIAKDDITESYFRSLYATLNHNSLKTIADGNGKQKYDLKYISPISFGGDLSSVVKQNYNKIVYVNTGITGAYATDFKNEIETPDAELVDSASTTVTHVIRRSSEERDSDYMAFRLGLDVISQNELMKKYILLTQEGYAMPVWENSFYFYFGLHNGSTALDKFRKEFYAECDKKKVVGYERLKCTLNKDGHTEDLFVDGINLPQIFDNFYEVKCGDLFLNIYCETYPITISHIFDGSEVKNISILNDSDFGGDNVMNDVTRVDVCNLVEAGILEYGVHTFIITDGDGRNFIGNLTVSRPDITVCENVYAQDFRNNSWDQKSGSELITETSSSRGSDGGFITGFNCGPNNNALFSYGLNYFTPEMIILVKNGGFVRTENLTGNTFDYSGVTSFLSDLTPAVVNENGEEQFLKLKNPGCEFIPVWETGIYALYVVLAENGTSRVSEPILVGYYEIKEPDTIDFALNRDIVDSPEEAVNTYRTTFKKLVQTYPEWWNIIDSLPISETKKWYLKKDVYLPSPSANELFEEDRDMLYLTLMFGDTITDAKIMGRIGSGEYKPMSEVNRYSLSGSTSQLSLYSVATRVDESGDSETIYVPEQSNPFIFRTLVKPFTFDTVVWEGYKDFGGEEPTFSSTIKNCITYDDFIGNGNSVKLNNINFVIEGNETSWYDPNTGEIKFVNQTFPSGVTFSNFYNSVFEVTEGSPKNFNSEYEPITLSLTNISTKAVTQGLAFKLILSGLTSQRQYQTKKLTIVSSMEGEDMQSTFEVDDGVFADISYRIAKTQEDAKTVLNYNTVPVPMDVSGDTYFAMAKTVVSSMSSTLTNIGVFGLIDTKDWLNIQGVNYNDAFYHPGSPYPGIAFGVARDKNKMTVSFALPYPQEKVKKIGNRISKLDVYYYFGKKHIELIGNGVSCFFGHLQNECISLKWGRIYGITFNYEEPDEHTPREISQTSITEVGLTEFFGDMYDYNRYKYAFKTLTNNGISGVNRIVLTTSDDSGNIIEIDVPVFDDCRGDYS